MLTRKYDGISYAVRPPLLQTDRKLLHTRDFSELNLSSAMSNNCGKSGENLRGRSTSIQGFIPATSDIRYQHGMRCIPYNLISNVYICFSSLYADRKGIKKGNSAPRELYQTKKGRVFCHYFSVAEISFVAEIRFWDIPRSYHKISLYIQGRTDIGLGSRYHKIRPLF